MKEGEGDDPRGVIHKEDRKGQTHIFKRKKKKIQR